MKKNMTKVMAMGMVMTILAGTTAFANETMLISEKPEAVTETTEAAEASMYLTQSGKVTSIETSETEGVSVVEISNEAGGLRFAVASSTIIVDRATGAYMTAAELTEGMAVSVVYDMNSPMGMSLPPYLGNVAAVVANADAGNVAVGKFDKDLTDWTNKLQLNIGDETSIQNMQGSRIRLTAEDVKGQDALVFYAETTKSIPAQTVPSFVLILGEQAAPAVSVPLRETAEANGFSVKWQGKTNPILLEKDGVSMEVMLGDATFKVNGVEEEAAFAAELMEGVMYVSSEIFE
ncbi:MAG: stalk domain-containing protein [Bacillota bacterium]|nr:stalk domain-containing protein [Bacillota bacterium]